MANTTLTPQTLMDYLTEKYKYLNDGGAKAKQMYDLIMSNSPSK